MTDMILQSPPSGWTGYFKGNGGFTVALLAALLPICFFAFVFGADGHLVVSLLCIGLVTALAEAHIRAGDGS
jgi:hypothetical protein